VKVICCLDIVVEVWNAEIVGFPVRALKPAFVWARVWYLHK